MTQSNQASRRRAVALAARVVWLLFAALNFGLFFASLAQLASTSPWADCPTAESGCQLNVVTNADIRQAQAAGISPQFMVAFNLGASLVARLSLALVAVAIFLLRPNDRMAWLMSLVLLTALMEGISTLGALQPLVDVSFAVGVVVWMPLPFIFPNGRIEPRWLKWLVVVLTLLIAPFWTPAMSVYLPGIIFTLVNLTTLVWAALGLYSMVYRYRRVSTPVERQQTKWVLVGFMAVFVTSLTYTYLQVLFPPWQPSTARLIALLVNGVAYVVGYLLLGGSLAFAILRYRLWDIDVVVRRTLLYSALTVTLALIYWGAVVVLQAIFSGMTGQNSVAIIGSTLLIAALFQPLRHRLQLLIDRRFFRRKYDAAQALAAFSAAARDDVDLTGVTSGLLTVVDETMQPATSAVWLRPVPEPSPPAPR